MDHHEGRSSPAKLLRASLLLTFLSCSAVAVEKDTDGPAASASNSEVQLQAARDLIDENWPASSNQLPTTSGAIYLGNLNAQITALMPLAGEQPNVNQRSGHMAMKLASNLYHRFQLTGQLRDAEHARGILAGLAVQKPRTPGFWQLQTNVLNGFHEFEAAMAALDQARKLGVQSAALDRQRADLEIRLGQKPLLADTGPLEPDSDYVSQVQWAAAALARGELLTASRQLKQAQQAYGDSNPFPVAWIHLQQGIAFLRNGDEVTAHRFFKAAHERLPQYYLATEHLAETELALGRPAEASRLYQQVIAQNDHPLFWYQLSQAETALGNTSAATQARERAAAGYEELLQRYPALYADHAARYYLDRKRPDRALALAQDNLRQRQDEPARRLLAEVALETGKQSLACDQVRILWQAGFNPPELQDTPCPEQARAGL